MEKELQISSEFNNNQLTETISCGELSIVITRSISGDIQRIQPFNREVEGAFIPVDTRTLCAEFEEGSVILETQPSDGLSRENSGHLPIPRERQMLVVDMTTKEHSIAFTIPVVHKSDDPIFGFSALENKRTRKNPLIPFQLSISHPDVFAPKTDIIELSQIFGHISAAARMLQAMPRALRTKTHIAARNIENVPKVVEHMQSMGLTQEDTIIPLTYDDASSGGANIQDRRRALWWLIQNPELIDQWLTSKIVITDLREEISFLKNLADGMILPQIFIGLTCTWPQRLNDVHSLPDDLHKAMARIPTTQEKLAAMREVGLGPEDAVVDWFSGAEKWKAGVRNGHAESADIFCDFSLINPDMRAPLADNILVMPPRTHLATNGDMENFWPQDKKRVLVLMGSGDWTERGLFTQQITQAAKLLPYCQLLIVGPAEIDVINQSTNVTFLGFIPPQNVDGLIKTCDIAVIKPGHFSLEETAGTLTLIAPTDNLQHSVEIAKRTGNPRSVAITVEVDEERGSLPIEKHMALGSPQNFTTLLDISTPQHLASQIIDTLARKDEFRNQLNAIPSGGTQLLVSILEQLQEMNFLRTDIPSLVQYIQERVNQEWRKKKI